MEPQVSSQSGGSPERCRSRSPCKTYVYFRGAIKAPAELFAYRVVLNGIVLARSTQGIVFTAYMTYRAFAGGGRHDASTVTISIFTTRRPALIFDGQPAQGARIDGAPRFLAGFPAAFTQGAFAIHTTCI
jgi:hypothetical protein